MSARAKAAGGSAVGVRAYRESDRGRVLELLLEAFGQWPGHIADVSPDDFFHWKHEVGAFGPSHMLVAELHERVVGFAAYMPWRLRAGAETLTAARGVDLVVDPACRRLGVSVAVRTAATERLAGEVAFLWGNPNEQAHPGGLRTGARDGAVIGHFVQSGRHWRQTLARAATKGSRTPEELPVEAESAAEALREEGYVAGLLAACRRDPRRLATATSPDYLRWRYGSFNEYRAIKLDPAGGSSGLAIFRERRHGPFWGADICELFVEGGDRRAIRRLLRGVRRAAPADFISCVFTSRVAAASCGLMPNGRGTQLTTLALRPGLVPDPAGSGSWELSRGDLELL